MGDCKLSKKYIPGLVSVIIPTHNRANIVSETIDSVFAQLYAKIELIMVDDHSTDNTEKVIKRKQAESKLYDFLYIKSNRRGGCAARNIGLIHSRGEYIQFFDDDDVMLPNHIIEKVKVLEACQIYDYITCNFKYFENRIDNIVGEKRVDNIEHTIESHLISCSLPAPSFMCRRNCIEAIGGWNENAKKWQDICYFHRLFLKKKNGFYLTYSLFLVRIHANNISSSQSKKSYISIIESLDFLVSEWKTNHLLKKSLIDIIFILKVDSLLKAFKEGYILFALGNIAFLSISNMRSFICLLKVAFLKFTNKHNSAYQVLIGNNVKIRN